MKKSLPSFIAILAAITLISVLLYTEHQPPKNPNIIIILADDAGYADFGFMGSKDMITPNLDKLAQDGIIFTDAHVSASVCSPSRAGLLTGMYQQKFGHECNLEPNQQGAFDHNQTTIAEYLSSRNYNTSIFGKWHLGEFPHQHPLENGFDQFWGFIAGSRSYFPNKIQDQPEKVTSILENHTPTEFEGYLTDVIGEKASQYIEKQASTENPFFMYLSFNAPHTPMHAKDDILKKFNYEDKTRSIYAAMVYSMDEAVGNVISTLKKNDMYENTLIFFLSDNGGAHNNGSSVFPLKGWKGNQYEGGTRVPFSVTWKNNLPSGETFDGLTSSLDIFSTIATLVEDTAPENLDGTNLTPYLKGNKKGNPHEKLFWKKDDMATVRMNNFKYITLTDTISVLYDLTNDLTEKEDLSYNKPETVESLKNELDLWKKQLVTPLWVEPEDWNKVTKIIYLDLMNNKKPIIKNPGDLKKSIE